MFLNTVCHMEKNVITRKVLQNGQDLSISEYGSTSGCEEIHHY
jgi:hypothetical protein